MKDHLVTASIAVASLFAPAKELMMATGCLIIADLILGILAARKQGQPITSAGLRRTVSKMLVYQLSVMSAFLVQKYMMGDLIPVSSIVSSMIGLVELKSIIENADKINGGSLMKDILARLGSVNDSLKNGTAGPGAESQPPAPQDQPKP